MKALVLIMALLLSAAVLSADFKDLSDGIKYQTVDGMLYDQHGNRYVLEGTFIYLDMYDNEIEKDCAGLTFATYPGFDWAINWEQYDAESIVGAKCKLVREIEEIEVKRSNEKELKVTEIETMLDSLLIQKSKFIVDLANFSNTVGHHIEGIEGFNKLSMTARYFSHGAGGEVILNRLKKETDYTYAVILIHALHKMGYKEALSEIAKYVYKLPVDGMDMYEEVIMSAYWKLKQPKKLELKTQAEKYLEQQ